MARVIATGTNTYDVIAGSGSMGAAMATNESLGVVMGMENTTANKGKITILEDGTMSVIGFDTKSYLPLTGGTLTGTLNSRAVIPTTTNTCDLGSTTLKWKNVYATTFTGNLSGNATTATSATSAGKLSPGKSISISGGATGTAQLFDGSKDIIIPVTSLDATTLTGTASIDTTGNAATATKLKTSKTINGTAFDGSNNITTTKWGLSRNITISDATGANTGTATSVDGSAAFDLKLPTAIKANLTGNVTGNASTASKLSPGKTINGVTFDGSSNITITAPTKKWNLKLTTTWNGTTAPYTQDVTCTGITANDIVNVYPVWSTTLATRKQQREQYNKLSMVQSSANKLTFTCDEEKPTIALDILVENISS